MLNSAALQLIAIVTMLIDHIGVFILNNNLITRAIGRFAMPLFCFMLTEGFLHTKGKRLRYFGRLIIFAFVSQFAYDLVHYAGAGGTLASLPTFLRTGMLANKVALNVLFTFTIGFLAMAAMEYSAWVAFCTIPILLVFAELLHTDYGAYGVLMIIGFYLVSKIFHKKEQRQLRIVGYTIVLFCTTTAHVLIKNNPLQMFALLSIIPIALYNGKLGRRLPKWFGYIFYPAHLLLIAVIVLIINAAGAA